MHLPSMSVLYIKTILHRVLTIVQGILYLDNLTRISNRRWTAVIGATDKTQRPHKLKSQIDILLFMCILEDNEFNQKIGDPVARNERRKEMDENSYKPQHRNIISLNHPHIEN